jgi:hypothetical protein
MYAAEFGSYAWNFKKTPIGAAHLSHDHRTNFTASRRIGILPM